MNAWLFSNLWISVVQVLFCAVITDLIWLKSEIEIVYNPELRRKLNLLQVLISTQTKLWAEPFKQFHKSYQNKRV